MTFYDIIFYILAVIIVFSAIIAIVSEKKVNIIAGLFCAFMGISGLLALLSAVTLALIYMIFFGIILTVLFLFMLPNFTGAASETDSRKSNSMLPVIMTGITTALLT